MRDVDAGEFGVRIKVSRKYSFTMVRICGRCFSDTVGQELCQVGLHSVPRPRRCNLWGPQQRFVPMPERTFESSPRWSEDQMERTMLSSGEGTS
jgi:hypothetical protein